MRFFILGNRRALTKRATLSHRLTYQPWRVLSSNSPGEMKRKATDSSTESKAKRPREPEVDYCDVVLRKDGSGNAIWPASEQSIERARDFLKEW